MAEVAEQVSTKSRAASASTKLAKATTYRKILDNLLTGLGNTLRTEPTNQLRGPFQRAVLIAQSAMERLDNEHHG